MQTPARVLSADELSGRAVTEPTPDAQAAVDLVWELLEEVGPDERQGEAARQVLHVASSTAA